MVHAVVDAVRNASGAAVPKLRKQALIIHSLHMNYISLYSCLLLTSLLRAALADPAATPQLQEWFGYQEFQHH